MLFKNPFLLKIFFGREMDRQALIEHVELGRADVQEELAELEAIEREIRDPEADFYGNLTLQYGIAVDRRRSPGRTRRCAGCATVVSAKRSSARTPPQLRCGCESI
jgi:hypothetical protein